MRILRSMKTKNLTIIFLLLLLSAGSSWARAETAPKTAPVVVWKDSESKRVIFTSADIITFDWSKQVFLLKRDAYLDFIAWVASSKSVMRELSVEDGDGLIYKAKWVSDNSSRGFKGPIYEASSPFISIVDSYPSGSAPLKPDDPRDSARLRLALEKAGLLENIDLTRDWVGLRVQSTSSSWLDCGPDLKTRIDYFGDTFQWGQKARAHIFFAGGEQMQKQIDSIAMEIRFVANQGRYRSDYRIAGISPAVITDGVYVGQFDLWKPVQGSELKIKSGTGFITTTLLFQKNQRGKLTTLYRLEFKETFIPVSIPIEAQQ